jgi:DNA-directed RNA polymerase specialized sigma24 family protein
VHVEGLSALEAANALRVGPGHARMMLTRARRKLLRRMGADPWQTGSRFATQEGDNR